MRTISLEMALSMPCSLVALDDPVVGLMASIGRLRAVVKDRPEATPGPATEHGGTSRAFSVRRQRRERHRCGSRQPTSATAGNKRFLDAWRRGARRGCSEPGLECRGGAAEYGANAPCPISSNATAADAASSP